jgi:hypothetical protein
VVITNKSFIAHRNEISPVEIGLIKIQIRESRELKLNKGTGEIITTNSRTKRNLFDTDFKYTKVCQRDNVKGTGDCENNTFKTVLRI